MARFLGTSSPARNITALPSSRASRDVAVPSSSLGSVGAALVGDDRCTVERIGPATDPIDLVVGFAAEALGRRQGSVVILVPGLGYAGRLTRRLARRGLPAIALSEAWDAARAGWPIVVGTRTAAFAPVPELAGVLVLDAEDERYRSEGAPTWSAVDVAIERGRRSGAAVALVTSCPSPSLAILPEQHSVGRASERGGWPVIVVADRTDADPRTGWFSEELARQGAAALSTQSEGIAVACILNRTGRAKLLACRRCGDLSRCASCDAAVALGDDELVCPRCSATRPIICAGCGATAMKRLRPGTAQLAEELSGLLGVPTAEVTASTTPEELVGARAVVGTEAIVHRIRQATLVAFLDLDSQLLASRPGAERSTLALIGRAGRIVGGREQGGQGSVILQTRLVGHPVVLAAIAGDPGPVVDADLELRRMLGLPPVRAAAVLKGPGAEELAATSQVLGVEVRPLGDGRVALLADDPTDLAGALERAGRPKDRVTVSVDVEIA
jgi:primosomal protein N' (replication factor Y)